MIYTKFSNVTDKGTEAGDPVGAGPAGDPDDGTEAGGAQN